MYQSSNKQTPPTIFNPNQYEFFNSINFEQQMLFWYASRIDLEIHNITFYGS